MIPVRVGEEDAAQALAVMAGRVELIGRRRPRLAAGRDGARISPRRSFALVLLLAPACADDGSGATEAGPDTAGATTPGEAVSVSDTSGGDDDSMLSIAPPESHKVGRDDRADALDLVAHR